MIDQTDYEQCLSESVKAQRHPYIGEALKAMCERLGLTLVSFRNGTSDEDKQGGDVMIRVKERTRELYVDLKLSNGAKAQRIAIEHRQGINQMCTPWSVDTTKKTDLVLWLNTSEKWAVYARKKAFTDFLLSLDDDTEAMLSSGFEVVKRTDTRMARFETKCTLVNRDAFAQWLALKSVGGVL